ncbi:hypothetical protein [Streptomyces sp. BK340]|uniref:hypothetical protein n=1 Tax=Streptomyces sp. BK340 TaxID=2572903 RepID=UPI0011ADC7C7|nr:hypothetical protein [Streptomyces sp. BK340]TVZ76292.1 hypothetical protein FB157_14523 [Streptomyces sp. BK340]
MDNTLTAAQQGGVRHVVILSVLGADQVPDLVRCRARSASPATAHGEVLTTKGDVCTAPTRYTDTMYITAPGRGDSGAGHVDEACANFDVKDWMSLDQGAQQLDWGNAEWLQVPALAAERLPYGWWSTATGGPGPTRTRR